MNNQVVWCLMAADLKVTEHFQIKRSNRLTVVLLTHVAALAL